MRPLAIGGAGSFFYVGTKPRGMDKTRGITTTRLSLSDRYVAGPEFLPIAL